MASNADAHDLIEFLRAEIPMAGAMDLRLVEAHDNSLSLQVPLAPNVNDKGCAFGGSLVSLMTLSGWALVEMALRRHDIDCDVFVAESTVRYLAPIWTDFRSDALLAGDASWDLFFSTLGARGKARINVDCVVPGADGKPACTLSARYVAKRRL